MNEQTFENLGLIEPLLRALNEKKYTIPTPIQAQAIPPLLEGKDLLGCAQTGTGKTAAFALPILQRLAAKRFRCRPLSPRVLVLSPTRELASQIHASFNAYGRHLGFRSAVLFGGVSQQPQVRALRQGIEILVATPGRLLDLTRQGHVRYDQVEVFVLDEADQMLDMGFLPDIRRVVEELSPTRQTLCFSATMPSEIRALAERILSNPVQIAVTPVASTVDQVEQRVLFVDRANKRALLELLLKNPDKTRVLVFTRTRHGADHLVKFLAARQITVEAIHGSKSQNYRERALKSFCAGRTRVLIATDVASRGLDIKGVTHVINFDLPEVPESYVHRIGRTARAGARGVAISFCDNTEHGSLRDIQRLIRCDVSVDSSHPYHDEAGSAAHHDRGVRKVRYDGRSRRGNSSPHHPPHARKYSRSGSHQGGGSGERRA